jgi:biotin carboxylase
MVDHKTMNKDQVSKRHVLIVGGGSDLMPRLRAVSPNIKTSVICRTSVLPFVHKIEDNQAVLVLPDHSPVDLWVQHAKKMHSVHPFDTVTSFAEIDQDKASAIAEALGLNYHSSKTIAWVHDKYLMRQRLKEAGIEDIPSAFVENPGEIRDFVEQWGYPVVLKPSRGRASTGISVIHSPEDIEKAFRYSKTASAPRLESSPLIVEPYLLGKEFSVEALSDQGEHIVLAIVEKYKDPVSKVEIGHVLPAPLSPEIEKQIEQYVANVLDALGIRFGITHTELIVTQDGPRIVETHVRPAGDEIPYLIHDSLGIDPLQYLVEQVAGMPIAERLRNHLRMAKAKQKSAAIWYAHVDIKGTLLEVGGIEEVKKAEGVREFFQLLKEGTQIDGLSSSYSRIAFVRTLADHPAEALRLARKAVELLEFRFSVRSKT